MTEIECLAAAANRIWEDRLRDQLRPALDGQFVAIEPTSGEHFIAQSLSEAIQAARRAHPSRMPVGMQIAETPVVPIGNLP